MRAKRFISVILSILIVCSSFAGLTAFADETSKNERTKDVVSVGADVLDKYSVATSDEAVQDQSGTTGECTWTYDASTKTLTVSGNGDMGSYDDWEAPAPWHDFRDNINKVVIENGVTSIGSYSFFYCEGITQITIPDSVISIGFEAFSGCTSLADITIPNSVLSIGEGAFQGCSNLRNIHIPNSVTSIGGDAFYNTADYNNQPNGVVYIDAWAVGYKGDMSANANIKLKDGTIGIADYVFDEQEDLKVITIPNSVKNMGSYAFYGCSSLESITIPNGVTSIGSYAFSGCYNLESITIPNSITSIGEYAFHNTAYFDNYADTVVYIDDWIIGYKEEMPENTNIELKYGTKGIAGSCFSWNENLSGIIIPDSVMYIEDSAFNGCSELTSAIIPDGVMKIGNYVFSGCVNLIGVTIPNSVLSIGEGAFECCSSLNNISIPNSVKSIGDGAFSSCNNLTSVNIPNSVVKIGVCAFAWCENLAGVSIPESVTHIGYCAFVGCDKLAKIEVDDKNLNYSSLNGDLYNKSMTKLIQYAIGKTDKTFVIPDSVTTIDDSAFQSASNLSGVIIPDSVTEIGGRAFSECAGLTSISIPDSVTSINSYLFECCSNLSVVEIGNSVTSIGYAAFVGCENLTKITIPDSVTQIEYYAFYNTAYYNNQPNGVVYLGKWAIGYKGSMPKSTKISLKSGTKGIANHSFAWQGNLISITIPDSVINIGRSAFSECERLADVYYRGTKAKWNNVNIGEYNQSLFGAKMHYVYNGSQVINVAKEQYKLTYGARSFNLGGKAKTALSYVSSNPKVAYVSSNGTVTIKGGGTATITITAKEANGYMPAKKIVKISVNKLNQRVTGVKSKYVTKGGNSFKLNAKAKSKLTYTSSNKKVAVVSSTGKVTVKGGGSAVITVKATESSKYKSAYVKTKIIASPRNFKSKDISKVKKISKTKAKITWKSLAGASGYKVQYATNKKFKGAKTVKNSKNKATLTKLKKGKTYYVRVQAYTKVSGKKYTNKWYTVKFKM